jgi:hypothetical protein
MELLVSLRSTVRDVAPIVLIILVFQLAVLKRPIARWQRVAAGFGCVILGLTMFLVGLERALFPLGQTMAMQLSDPAFIQANPPAGAGLSESVPWYRFHWTYLFAFAIGFSATIAEPALLAVALKAHDVSGGTLQVWPLRAAVALGAGVGVMLGTVRIVTGIPLPWFILAGYSLVILQTRFAPGQIVPLAYDSGGVTTSTVTVPLVAALGLGLASRIPGRNPLEEGFGMIALTVMFPMITVMGYAQLAQWWSSRGRRSDMEAGD